MNRADWHARPGPYLPSVRDRGARGVAVEDRVVTTEAALTAARKAGDDLCAGRLRWERRVPAEPDHDPDLIISRGLDAAEAEISQLRVALAEIAVLSEQEGNAATAREAGRIARAVLSGAVR